VWFGSGLTEYINVGATCAFLDSRSGADNVSLEPSHGSNSSSSPVLFKGLKATLALNSESFRTILIILAWLLWTVVGEDLPQH